jgi:glycosyltransferase involved in cell wall biosynthesis
VATASYIFLESMIYMYKSNTKIKILQITAYYPPSIGGIQYYVQSLSHYLSSKGHQVDILTINTDQSKAYERTAEGMNLRRCKLDLSLYRALMSREFNQALMSATNYDVYHIHIPFHVGLEVAAAASKQNNIPLVATHHGQGLIGSPLYTLMAGTYSWFSRILSLQGVDRTIFLTQSYAQSLWLPKRIRKRMRIVRTGADIERFSPHHEGEQIRQRYQIDQNAPLILFVGSLHKANRYKGVDYLIRAMCFVTQVVKDTKLMIVGGGELQAELQTLTQQMNLADQIIFTGAVDNAHLPHYYAAADLFVLPSIRGPENSPIVVFEAMASAMAVVASDLPGLRDIIQHEENGLLVPPKNIERLAIAIMIVLVNKEFRQQLGHKARQMTENHSWEQCAHEMEMVYGEVIKR